MARLNVIDCDDENDEIPLGLLLVCLSAACLSAACLSAACLSAARLLAARLSAICLSAVCLLAVCLSAVCLSPFYRSNRLADPIICASFPVSPSFVDSLDSEF
jgi:hypothetical protein